MGNQAPYAFNDLRYKIKARIGKNVKILREANNMTAKQLSRKLKMALFSIYGVEAGQQALSIERLYLVSKIFKVSMDDLAKRKMKIKVKKVEVGF